MSEAGEIVRLASGGLEVDVLPALGARIHRLRVDGDDVLRTPPDPSTHVGDPWFWGSYVMAPWCNRLDAGSPTELAGRVVDLPANFLDGTAIHGQVSGVPWRQTADTAFVVEAGGDGWPWRYAVAQAFELGTRFVRIALVLTNLDDAPMPAGIGIHPWFRRPARVRIAGDAAWDANPSPAAHATPVAGDLDRRRLAELPDDLDATWTDLSVPPVVVAWPDAGLRLTMTTEPAVAYIVAASPGPLDAVAIEPETHAPAGLRRLLNREPGGLEPLDPGAALRLTVELAFDRVQT